MLQFRWEATSDTGLVRDNNEDSGFAGPYLLLVADGVGGAAAGEVASSTAAYVTTAMSMIFRDRDPLDLLQQAVALSHEQLRLGVALDPARRGMATTLTALLTDGERVGLVNVGDSRAYLLRAGRLQRLTTDHTLVQSLVDAGHLSAEQAQRDPRRSLVLRSVDAVTAPEPDLRWVEVQEGDRLLVCSDGLTDLVPETTVSELLGTPSRASAATALVRAALDTGGRDNVTCVGADVVEADPISTVGNLVGAVPDLSNVVDPAAVSAPRTA